MVRHFSKKFPGQVIAWDVVNEAFNENGSIRDCTWTLIGQSKTDYIKLAFQAAREADPTIKLYYNEYGAEGLNPKSEAVYQMVKSMRQQNVPIDGVGFQMHRGEKDPFLSREDFENNITRLEKLGFEITITEADYALKDRPMSSEQLSAQREFFQNILGACLNLESCKAFEVWGFTDKYSWIPDFEPGMGRATLFDADLSPKAAYCGIHAELSGSLRK